MLKGFAPFNPMRSMVLPFAWQPDMPHNLWIECDLPWVDVADAVLRLPGYSVGADAELKYAMEKGIPVFFGIDQLEAWNEHRRTSDVA
jgi:hypothetical protein